MKTNNTFKIQRVLVYSYFVVAILFAIVGLGFMTNIFPLFYSYGEGHSEYFKLLQPLNHAIFYAAITMIVLGVVFFIFDIHKSKAGYISTIFTGVVAYYSLTSMMVLFRAIPHYKAKYQALDFTEIEDYTPSTLVFDLSYILAVLITVIISVLTVLVIKNLIVAIKAKKAKKMDKGA